MTMNRSRSGLAAVPMCAVFMWSCAEAHEPASPLRAALTADSESRFEGDPLSSAFDADFDRLYQRGSPRWPTAGHDLHNSRSQPSEHRISPRNASTLTVKWVFETQGDVWATPALTESELYVPDSAGNLFALDRKTGQALWQRKIEEYSAVPGVIARTTPAISGDALILGDQGGRLGAGASVFAVRRSNGDLLWSVKVDENPSAVITQSPVVYRGRVYVGVSSVEETAAATVAGYPCCSFRGSMLALDKETGAVLWKQYTVPGSEAPGYAGGAVWGSTPVIDPWRGSVYIGSGNNYVVPQGILDCQARPVIEVQTCVEQVAGSDHNFFDSILALDLQTGAIKWAHVMIPFDSWNVSCIFAASGNAGNCTDPKGEDFDFGQGPTLYDVRTAAGRRQLLGAGQKSGVYWALNPDDGSVVWNQQVGPGASLGGLQWGSATDGKRIYTAVSNSQGRPWILPNGQSTISGFWSALDPATGAILWQTSGDPIVKSSNQGAVSVANGVVYAGTVDIPGTMYALDAASGETLWTFASGGSVNSGAAISDGTVYWGSGYGVRGIGISRNNKLYAFVLPEECRRSGSCAGNAGSGGGAGAAGASGAGAGGANTATGAGGAAGGGAALPTTWSAIYQAYLGPGTIGHCSGCHSGVGRIVPLNTAAVAYDSLVSVGQIDGADSAFARPGASRLSWFGGDMPPGGLAAAPDAERAIADWVAAGAPND